MFKKLWRNLFGVEPVSPPKASDAPGKKPRSKPKKSSAPRSRPAVKRPKASPKKPAARTKPAARKKPASTTKKRAPRQKRKPLLPRRKSSAQPLSTESPLRLVRHGEKPIIMPRAENGWEAWQTFNPGVVEIDGQVHFLYRAMGGDGISRFGYGLSPDGLTINSRLPYPVYEHRLVQPGLYHYHAFASGGGFGGAEDPRIVRVENEDRLYVTYTACDSGLHVGITSIAVDDFINNRWAWSRPQIISNPRQTSKNWVIFPEKINGKYAILHSIYPEISIAYRDSMHFRPGEFVTSYYNGHMRRKNCWDNWVRGAGAPPLKTRAGWLLFYHAMDHSDPGKYKVGALLLDLNDPTKILHRAQEPILEPEHEYENNGFKAGVVYVSGAVIKNGELLVYYGASDSYVSVARAGIDNFLDELTGTAKPKLFAKILKKKRV